MSDATAIRLYRDEDVPLVIARLLQGYGYAASTTRDAGNLGHSDDDQLSYAAAQGFTLLTHNRNDFRILHRAWQGTNQHHSGIIAAFRHPPYEVMRRLLPLLNAVTAAEMRDQFRFL